MLSAVSRALGTAMMARAQDSKRGAKSLSKSRVSTLVTRILPRGIAIRKLSIAILKASIVILKASTAVPKISTQILKVAVPITKLSSAIQKASRAILKGPITIRSLLS